MGRANRHRVCFLGDENLLKLIVVMVVQAFENTRNDRLLYFKWGDCLVAVVQRLSHVTP